MDSEQVAALVKGALDIAAPLMVRRTHSGRFSPPPPVPESRCLLSRLRRAYPGWAIVADLRGGRWAAANGVTQIWRCDGIELAKALEAATGRTWTQDMET